MTSTLRGLAFALLLLGTAGGLWAQGDRIIPLNGNLRPAALRHNDGGRVDGHFRLPAMTLFLKRSATQQASLRQLLEDQQNPASPLYHQWLAPEEFADRFGLNLSDVTAAADWLRSQGVSVGKVARSRTWIVFRGTARSEYSTTECHPKQRRTRLCHRRNGATQQLPAIWLRRVRG